MIKEVVYLSESQYLELQTNGTLTVGEITLVFNEDTLYVTKDVLTETVEQLKGDVENLKNAPPPPSVSIDNNTITKNENDEIQCVAIKEGCITIEDTIGKTDFKGVVSLSEEQYSTLVADGSITIGDVTINYDENVIYVTPDEDDNYLPLTGGVIEGNLEVQQTLTVQNIELNGVDLDDRISAIENTSDVIEALNSAIKNKADINTSEFAKEFAAGASEIDISSVYAWDKITAPTEFTQRQRACIYGNGYYVIAGTGGQVVYSKDGVNWFMLPSFTTGIITGLAYGNGYFLAVDSNGGIYRTDIPLNTWNNVHTFTGIIEAIRYINNTFVAVGANGFIGVSSDGKTWNEKQSGTTSNIIDVTYGNGKYVAVGAAGTILTSINAEIWYPQTIEGHTTDIRTVCYANGMFVIGTSGGRIDYSENGETWSQANNPSTNTISWIRAFSYSNNRLYTVMYTSSGAGEIWLSKDKGASWEVAQTTTGRLWCVTFGEDKFITSGDNGAIYVLNLNVEWSKTPIDAKYKWYRFKTTQNNGNIIYSDAYYDAGGSSKTEQIIVTQEMVIDNILTLQPNTYYVIPSEITLTSITLELGDSGVLNEYNFEFTGRTEMTFPSNWKWANGTVPTLVADKTYQISVINNLAVCGEFY